MKRAELLTALGLMALGGIVLFDAARLGFGWGADGPKSGFFPFWLAIILVLSCAVILVQTQRRPLAKPFVTREQLRPVLAVLWPAAMMVVITQVAGIYVASAIYLGFYMRWVGRHSWRAIAVLSIAVPVVTFIIFEQWFLVPLPKGPLEIWLGY